MPSNGIRRMNAKNPGGIPGIGKAMHQSEGDVGGGGSMPGVQQAMHQGGPSPKTGTIPGVQSTMGQGGKPVGRIKK
jgi:hypothetical protein